MRTVHGLQHVLFAILGCMDGLERIFTIVSIVSTGDIQVLTANMRSNDLLIAKTLLYFAQHLLQTQAKFCSFWQPNRHTLAHTIREHKEFHFLSNLAMVTFLGFFQHQQVLIQHLLLGEGNAVNSGELCVFGITTPESACDTCYFNSLNQTSGHQMRPTTKVSKIALRIGRDVSIFQIFNDVFNLVRLPVCRKLIDSVGLGKLTSNNWLVFLGQFHHFLFNLREVIL